MRRFTPLFGMLVFAAVTAQIHAAVCIEDDLYAVSIEPAQGRFTVVDKRTSAAVLADGRLSGVGGTATPAAVDDPVLGRGRCVRVVYADGRREEVALYNGLPFVTFRTTFHNGSAKPVVLNREPTVSAAVNLGIALSEITTLGTGGLLAPGKNPGSYAILAVADPASRAGVVAGWLTHDRGSGVVFSPVDGKAVRIQARLDYGRLLINPGQDAAGEVFAIGSFPDIRLGLEAYADAVARAYRIALKPVKPGHCTWYMDKYAFACDEKHLAELATFAASRLKPFGFDFVQIDDGWQPGTAGNGPRKNFTTHAPKGPYPSGMKATADGISAQGLTPGIWFIPFAGTAIDPYFKDHQDWFAKGPDGKPYDTAWGGTCLDMTHPGAREHLRGIVARIAHEWGYRLFKMDGFWTGSATRQNYINNGYREDELGESSFHDPNKTNVEVLRDGVRLVREAAGPDVFLLGCCASQNMRSFGGSFGLLDAMRVGPDTGAGHIGAPNASRLWFLNGRVWWNDPDCVSVRAATPLDQARVNASFTAISGGLFYNSDWMPDLPEQRLDILRRCMPTHAATARPVDVLEAPVARIWHVVDERNGQRRDVVALFNWEGRSTHIGYSAQRIGLPPATAYVAFDFWTDRFIPPFTKTVEADLPRNSCRILAVRPVADHPQLLSTSRHLTQGMIEVSGEHWDASAATLSGSSQMVADDRYELRIVLPTGPRSWQSQSVTVSAGDAAAGVAVAAMKQEGPCLRVVLTSPISRAVAWTVNFVPGSVAPAAPSPAKKLTTAVEYPRIDLSWEGSSAQCYRVSCSDGRRFVVPATDFSDREFPRGKALTYTVEGLGWNGEASAPASVTVTPLNKIALPPEPPKPTVGLAELKPSVTTGQGRVAINFNAGGKGLNLGGRRYPKGYGLRPRAEIVCAVPKGATRFVAVTGLDDSALRREDAVVVIELFGDVKEMGEQPVSLARSPSLSKDSVGRWHFDVPLDPRFREIRLVITADGDGDGQQSFVDVAEAGFIMAR